jgi:hypothetical protein
MDPVPSPGLPGQSGSSKTKAIASSGPCRPTRSMTFQVLFLEIGAALLDADGFAVLNALASSWA